MNIRNYCFFFAACAAVPLVFAACSNGVDVSKPQFQAGQTITTDTLPAGPIKGTLISGRTYYFSNDILVNKGDTLALQSGVSLIALPPTTPGAATPQISVSGCFISLGTKGAPNYIGPPQNQRTYANLFAGLWGGIEGDSSSDDIIVKWTHLESMGGAAGNGNKQYKVGDPRFGIFFTNANSNFILEDSWIRGAVDDAVRTKGARISAMRNTFEFCGEAGGDALNMKGQTQGDVAYNLFIGTGTNGPKLANASPGALPINVNIYNNTILNGGWRCVESGRAGSTNIENGARGKEYNSLIVNCKTGFRLVPDADIANVSYDNMYYYGQSDSMAYYFYPPDGVQKKQPHDIAGGAKANNPQFVNYNVDQFNFFQAPLTWPIALKDEPNAMNEVGTSDFHLSAGSPAIGKGNTGFSPMQIVSHVGGDLGATITPPGKDIGAYQTDGTGNQH